MSRRVPRALTMTDLRVAKIRQKINPGDCSQELAQYAQMYERCAGDTALIPFRVVQALDDCKKNLRENQSKLNLGSLLMQYTRQEKFK